MRHTFFHSSFFQIFILIKYVFIKELIFNLNITAVKRKRTSAYEITSKQTLIHHLLKFQPKTPVIRKIIFSGTNIQFNYWKIHKTENYYLVT